jgi:hypothetical protein
MDSSSNDEFVKRIEDLESDIEKRPLPNKEQQKNLSLYLDFVKRELRRSNSFYERRKKTRGAMLIVLFGAVAVALVGESYLLNDAVAKIAGLVVVIDVVAMVLHETVFFITSK